MISNLSESLKRQFINNNYWNSSCYVSLERLKIITDISFYDFNGDLQNSGQMIVFDAIADHVLEIFEDLKSIKFPLSKIDLISNYDNNDEKSMDANNSVCFCFRRIKNSNVLSMHAYGMAIDINPVQNPVIYTDVIPNTILPNSGRGYIDRTNIRKGMINNRVVQIFANHGFDVWGGTWDSPTDYHHFNIQKNVCNNLIALDYKRGKEFFNTYIKN